MFPINVRSRCLSDLGSTKLSYPPPLFLVCSKARSHSALFCSGQILNWILANCSPRASGPYLSALSSTIILEHGLDHKMPKVDHSGSLSSRFLSTHLTIKKSRTLFYDGRQSGRRICIFETSYYTSRRLNMQITYSHCTDICDLDAITPFEVWS